MRDSSLGYVGLCWAFLDLIVAIRSYNLATVVQSLVRIRACGSLQDFYEQMAFLVRTDGEIG